jgi:hypothetical protein
MQTPMSLHVQGGLVSKHPVSSLTAAQAVAEHEQLLGQLKVQTSQMQDRIAFALQGPKRACRGPSENHCA